MSIPETLPPAESPVEYVEVNIRAAEAWCCPVAQ